MAWLWKQDGQPCWRSWGPVSSGIKRSTGDTHRWDRDRQRWGVGRAHGAPAADTTFASTTGKARLSRRPQRQGLTTRVTKEVREDDCLGWAAQLAYYLMFAVFLFALFDRPAGVSAHPQPAGAHPRRTRDGRAGGSGHAS